MELEIIKEKENKLFARKEVQIKIESPVSPSKNEMTTLIAQKFSTQPENISVKGIHGRFGSKSFMVNVNIYTSKEVKEEVELKKKKGAKSQETSTEAPAQKQVENKIEEKTE
jgi:ribosomal protein S24E